MQNAECVADIYGDMRDDLLVSGESVGIIRIIQKNGTSVNKSVHCSVQNIRAFPEAWPTFRWRCFNSFIPPLYP